MAGDREDPVARAERAAAEVGLGAYVASSFTFASHRNAVPVLRGLTLIKGTQAHLAGGRRPAAGAIASPIAAGPGNTQS